MTTFGVHALVFQGGTSRREVEDMTARARQLGYDLLEISLHDLDNLDLDHAAACLRDAGLAVACSRGLAFDADPSSDDLAVVRRGADLLHQSLEATDRLGGGILTGALYGALGKYDRQLTSAGRRNVVGVLRDLAGAAADRGITLGVEVCNRYETNVVNTAHDALRLMDEIGSDSVVLHLDTYHMNIEEKDVVRTVRDAADRLGYLHVGENDRGYLGSGHIDFPGLFEALVEIGYQGPITFESFSDAVVSPTLSIDLAIWRRLWDDGDDLAAQALTAMRGWTRSA